MQFNCTYIELSSLLSPERARGVEPGKLAKEQLIEFIEARANTDFVEISMKEFAFIDVSFARECIINLIRHYAGNKAIILSNFQDDFLIDNITVSTSRFKVCILSKNSQNNLFMHGPNNGKLSNKDKEIWEIISTFDAISSSKLASLMDKVSSSAAHGKLKKLSDMGLLFKKRGKAKSGGVEDIFYPVTANYQ